jgi:hypothetical protein
MIKTQNITDKRYKIQVSKGSAFKYETGPDMLKCHQLMILCGCRGSGKTLSLVNYLRMLKQDNNCDRILVISPTFTSNREMLMDLGIDDNDVFSPDDKQSIVNVYNIIQQEADEYERYIEDLREYEKVMRLIRSNKDISQLDPEILLKMDLNNFEKPTYKYKQECRLGLICDDCQSTRLFGQRLFNNMCCRNRHLGAYSKDFVNINGVRGGAMGCSMYLLVQNWSSNVNPIPKSVRNNSTSLILFKCRDSKELDNIYRSVAGEIDEDSFYKIYNYCTEEKYSFMLIDLFPKHDDKKYRKNFNQYVSLSNIPVNDK